MSDAKLLTETANYDEPGSWGRMSNGWPEIRGDKAYAIYLFANRHGVIPYGSYVLMSQKGRYGAREPCLRIHAHYIKKLKEAFRIAGSPSAAKIIQGTAMTSDLETRLLAALEMASQKSEQYCAERKAHEAMRIELRAAQAWISNALDDFIELLAKLARAKEALEEAAVRLKLAATDGHEAARMVRALKDRPQTCFECGADLVALAPICPRCNPNYQSAAHP